MEKRFPRAHSASVSYVVSKNLTQRGLGLSERPGFLGHQLRSPVISSLKGLGQLDAAQLGDELHLSICQFGKPLQKPRRRSGQIPGKLHLACISIRAVFRWWPPAWIPAYLRDHGFIRANVVPALSKRLTGTTPRKTGSAIRPHHWLAPPAFTRLVTHQSHWFSSDDQRRHHCRGKRTPITEARILISALTTLNRMIFNDWGSRSQHPRS